MLRDEETAHVGQYEMGIEAASASGWREAHRQLQRLARKRAALDAEEARWLLIARDAQVHRELGFATFHEYLERTLGYRPRTARERLRVAEALEELPVLREALAGGAASYSAVRELTRVATPETEEAWLDAADGKTVRDIEEMISGRAPGDLPEDPADPDLQPRTLRLELTPEVYAAWLETRRALEDEAGSPLDDSDVMAALCRRATEERPTGAATRARHQFAVTVCTKCDRATVDAAGQIVDVPAAALTQARCDAEHFDARGDRTVDIPRKSRTLVERRDHHRCTVPGCRSSRGLEIHHIVDRARGGDHAPANLTLLCAAHHVHHDGRLHITGTAPDRLRFEHADRRPYGADPRGVDHFTEAKAALRQLGFTAQEAKAAAERAAVHVGRDLGLEAIIRACLRECPRPG